MLSATDPTDSMSVSPAGEGVSYASFGADTPPILVVVVDTEETFDWKEPLSRHNISVSWTGGLQQVTDINDDYGIRPTYLMDYPIAIADETSAAFRSLVEQGVCEVGAHLHPWVNPPHDEELNEQNSYPGNLPYELEYQKLKELTDVISERIGVHPKAYKSGRYGLGPNTYKIMTELGYCIDTSVMTNEDMRPQIGLDFRAFPDRPYWTGTPQDILEVPITRGIMGPLGGHAPKLFHLANQPGGKRWKLPGMLARMGLAEESKLTPEGVNLEEKKRFTRTLLNRGHKVFCYTYHSSSLVVGGTPYVQSEIDLENLIGGMNRYFEFFMGELGGQAMTLTELYDQAVLHKPATKP